jgi:hypothetical protein
MRRLSLLMTVSRIQHVARPGLLRTKGLFVLVPKLYRILGELKSYSEIAASLHFPNFPSLVHSTLATLSCQLSFVP